MFGNKAMVVDLTISMWNARRFDPQVTDQTNTAHNASANAGRYTKALVNPDLLKPVARARTALENYHKQNTAPWNQGGGRLLPSIKFMEYTTHMRQLKTAFEVEVRGFLAQYTAEVAQAPITLGTMYNATEYPSLQDVKEKFNVVIDTSPLADMPDWRTSLAQEDAEEATAAMKESYERKEKAVVKDSYQRAQEVVQKMFDTLSDPTKIFRDSLVDNVQTVAELLPALNLTNDPHLDKIVVTMQAELCGSAQQMRDDPVFRQKTANAAGAILSELAQGLT